jgi:hypothetical protein
MEFIFISQEQKLKIIKGFEMSDKEMQIMVNERIAAVMLLVGFFVIGFIVTAALPHAGAF